jgi:hypothetical protein
MKRLLLAAAVIGTMSGTVRLTNVTYYRDVLPVLQQHCLSCHAPGQIAPISFLSYRQTRPWADAIKQVVVTGKMPLGIGAVPWHREHPLSMRDIDTIVAWVDGGAVAGDPKDAPPPAYPEEAILHQNRLAGVSLHQFPLE